MYCLWLQLSCAMHISRCQHARSHIHICIHTHLIYILMLLLQSFREDPDVKVLLISLKAGGVALNLTVANHIFLMVSWHAHHIL
jgi:hypothetical protein